jgi:hypothetical protein
MFIKHAVPVTVMPQHTGLEEVLRAKGNRLSPSGEQEGMPVTSNNYDK